MVFYAVFNIICYIMAVSAPIHAFLIFFSPVLSTISFSSHWLLSHITIAATTDSGQSRMNSFVMTIINPKKEDWPSQDSNLQPPVFKCYTLPKGLQQLNIKKIKIYVTNIIVENEAITNLL